MSRANLITELRLDFILGQHLSRDNSELKLVYNDRDYKLHVAEFFVTFQSSVSSSFPPTGGCQKPTSVFLCVWLILVMYMLCLFPFSVFRFKEYDVMMYRTLFSLTIVLKYLYSTNLLYTPELGMLYRKQNKRKQTNKKSILTRTIQVKKKKQQ